MYIVLFIGMMIISLIVSQVLKSKFRKYSALRIGNGYTGKDIAEKMLRDNGIYDVQVISVEGQLTDHYNPETKTVNLSQDVYSQSNISAAAVAAHECGHAVQHKESYAFLKLRTALVPAVSFASSWMQWVLLAGILMVNRFPQLLLAGIVLFAATTLFSFITLPVEIDASRRALLWLNNSGISNRETQPKAQDALKWAAYTYVVAALASLATLLYYIAIFNGRRN
jgi:uncharacterized protein